MSNVKRLLPTLAINGQLLRDFLAAPAPCFTLGVVKLALGTYSRSFISPKSRCFIIGTNRMCNPSASG
jgi:hypothetical protein